MNTITQCFKGAAYGHRVVLHERQESVVRQGRNFFMAGLFQTVASLSALTIISEGFKAASKPSPNIFLKGAYVVTPGLLAYAASRNNLPSPIKKLAVFAHDHFGKLQLGITAVSIVSMGVFGQPALAITAAAYFGVMTIVQLKIIPEKYRRICYVADRILGTSCGIIFGDLLLKVICVVEFAVEAFNLYHDFKKKRQTTNEDNHPESKPVASKFTGTNMKDFMRRSYIPLEVDRSHLKIETSPKPKKLNCDYILELTKTVDWKKHLKTIESRIKNDERAKIDFDSKDFATSAKEFVHHLIDAFLTFLRKATGKGKNQTINKGKTEVSDAADSEKKEFRLDTPEKQQRAIAFIQNNINHVVDAITNRKIEVGEPSNYQILHEYLAYISETLEKMDNEIEKADVLIRLAIEAGRYCGSGVFEAVEDIYGYHSNQAPLTFEARLLNVLKEERKKIWQQMYESIWKINVANQLYGKLIDKNDIHMYNSMCNLFNIHERFGLPNAGAANDELARVRFAEKFVFEKVSSVFLDIFWTGGSVPIQKLQKNRMGKWDVQTEYVRVQGYDSDRLVELIQNAGPSLPRQDFFLCISEWIDKQVDLSSTEKESLQDDLTEKGKFFGIEIEKEKDGKRAFNPKFIEAVLLATGVLKIA